MSEYDMGLQDLPLLITSEFSDQIAGLGKVGQIIW